MRLIIAILEDAVRCFQGNALAQRRSGQRLFEEAEQWIMSMETTSFSFEHICEVLDLDPECLRAGLDQWHAGRVAAAAAGGARIACSAAALGVHDVALRAEWGASAERSVGAPAMKCADAQRWVLVLGGRGR
ncbi:MAG: hypothetical protein ABI629_06600 [bacterium]